MAVAQTLSLWEALAGWWVPTRGPGVASRAWLDGARDATRWARVGRPPADRGFDPRRPAAYPYPPRPVPPRPAAPFPVPPRRPPVNRRARRRLGSRLWSALVVLVTVTSLTAGGDRLVGSVWAEIPGNAAMLQVQRGSVDALVDGKRRTLNEGDQTYVHDGDAVSLDTRSSARLLFRGGGYTTVCGGSKVAIGAIGAEGHPDGAVASLDLVQGRLLAYTASQSAVFGPLGLAIDSAGSHAVSQGVGRFAIGYGGLDVDVGQLRVDGAPVTPSGVEPTCGDYGSADGVFDYPWSGGPSKSPSGGRPASASPSASPSPSASATPSPSDAPTSAAGDQTAPTFRSVSRQSSSIYSKNCTFGNKTSVIDAHLYDPDDAADKLTVSASWTATGGSGSITMRWVQSDLYEGTLGPLALSVNRNVTISVKVTARDEAGNTAKSSSVSVTYVYGCPLL